MRCASLSPSLTALDVRRLGPVTQLIRVVRSLPQDDGAGQGSRDAPALPSGGGGGGRRLMRRIMIAAAIASGLIALWAAILPLAA